MRWCLVAFVALRAPSCERWSSAMIERHQHAARCVYLLADSLDSILAACEDWPTSQQVKPGTLLQLELAAITHVLQARRYIDELDEADPQLVDDSRRVALLTLAGGGVLALAAYRRAIRKGAAIRKV